MNLCLQEAFVKEKLLAMKLRQQQGYSERGGANKRRVRTFFHSCTQIYKVYYTVTQVKKWSWDFFFICVGGKNSQKQ